MTNVPQGLKGALIVNISDDAGRTVIPNAIFAFEQRLRLIGVGSIPVKASNKFTPLKDGNGYETGIKLGTIDGNVYLMKEYPAVLKTTSMFATDFDLIHDKGEDIMVPYKKLWSGGIEESHTTIIPDCELVLLAPYQTQVSSGSGAYVYFFLKKNMAMARIPLPNSYADGKFCIGTGVTFSEIPTPTQLIDGVYQSLMNDRYNMDLWESIHESLRWVPQNGQFVCTVPFERCQSIFNDNLFNLISC